MSETVNTNLERDLSQPFGSGAWVSGVSLGQPKLSKLQKSVLVAARRLEKEHGGHGGRTYRYTKYSRLLESCFGLRTWSGDSDQAHQWGKTFVPKTIGRKRYRSAVSSLSRTVARLEQRGLVEWTCGAYARWSGITLTDEGHRVAEQLAGLQ